MPAFGQRLQGSGDGFEMIGLALLDVVALRGKLGNISTRCKRLIPGAAQHNTTQAVIRRQFMHHARELAPHRNGQRVKLGGIVDGNGGNDAIAREVD